MHVSTVSRALNPATRTLVGRETVTRVEQVARDLGYHHNAAAASLRTGRSKLVGVFLPDISNTVFSPILGGITEVLSEQGFSIIVADVGAEKQRQLDLMFELMARRVEGLILATVSRKDNLVGQCIADGLPVVLVNRAEGDTRVSAATSDDRLGMRLAVEHLRKLGHRCIGHIAGPQNLSTGYLRREGFEQAAAALGLAGDDAPIEIGEAYSRGAGAEAAKRLLARAPRPTAIVAANDLLALGAYDAVRAAGLKIPRDISIVGHNDMPLVDLVEPPLTTIRISHRELGREAARLLLSEIAEEHAPKRNTVLTPELIIRGSTAAPGRPGTRGSST